MDKKYQMPGGKSFFARRREKNRIEIREESEKQAAILDLCIQPQNTSPASWEVRVESKTKLRQFWIQRARSKRIIAWPGGSLELEAQEYSEGSAGSSGKLQPLKLTMPGKVLAVKTQVGDIVEAGQGLVIVEAMKMENLLQAPAKAKIAKIHVQTGDRLESGTILITFAPWDKE